MTKTEGFHHNPDASAAEATHSGPPCDPSEWLTVNEVAKVAKCGRRLIYREVKAGRLRAARLGLRRDIRVHRDWIREWLERCAAPIEVMR